MLALPPALDSLLRALEAGGFRPLIVGGAVRDALLGLDTKDFDIEVYGVTYERLVELLSRYGRTDLVGKSFGVVKLVTSDGAACDFGVPRRDNKIGVGHRDFQSTFDLSITPREAANRRDFTLNAMAYDPISGQLLDFFNGAADLKQRVLRATGPAFSEDPLRVLRGMQLACRFDLTLDSATAELSRSIANQYSTLPKERVAEEFMKWAVKSARPGRLVNYLIETAWIGHFPEIQRMIGVPQDPERHPEGNVDVHTMLVTNAAANIAARENVDGDDRAVLLFSALAHDFAKADTTALRERNGRMRLTSFGHEAAGGPLARAFLTRIGIKSAIVDQVVPLVENHLAHSSIGREATPRSIRRLASRLAPASITQLIRLIEADHSGRPPLPPGLPEGAVRIRDMAAAEDVALTPQSALILGRHVLPYVGDRAGPHIGEVTRAAYEAQLDGAFSTDAEAAAWLGNYMKEHPAECSRESN